MGDESSSGDNSSLMHFAYPSPKNTLDHSHGPALQPRPSCPCWQFGSVMAADDPALSGLMPRMDGSGPCFGVDLAV